MSIGLNSLKPLGSGLLLASAGGAPISATGLRDTFQTLATQTATAQRFSANYLFGAIETTKPLLDSYAEALSKLPKRYLKEGARSEFYRLYRQALQGDSTAQLAVQSSMLGIAHYLFSHRPHWLLDEASVQESLGLEPTMICKMTPSLQFGYKVQSQSGNVHVQDPDPAWMTLEAYRVAVETTLLKLMTDRKPYRMIFVPGLRSSGKSSHIIKHLHARLLEEFGDDAVEHINVKDRRNGINSFINDTMPDQPVENLPRFTLVDNTPSLIGNAGHRRHIAAHVAEYLNGDPRRVIVFFGGSRASSQDQMTAMSELFKNLMQHPEWADRWTEVRIEAKPLNFIQAMQVLTEEGCQLAKKEKIAYTEFVLERVPPYLSALRTFALIPRNLQYYNQIPNAAKFDGFKDLETALNFFRIVYERDIMTALSKSLIVPEGYELEESSDRPRDIQTIIAHLKMDIEAALDWARESQI